MSKAFTREDDSEEPGPVRPPPSLAPGAKNYITPDGAERLRLQLESLRAERASFVDLDRSQSSRLDQRMSSLQATLATLVVVVPADSGEARFGSIVQVRYPSGETETFRIVGVNEIDLGQNWISWQSPLAKALMNAKPGQTVQFKSPAGEQKLEIISVQ